MPKALQRMAKSGRLRRIDRGLYDVPTFNALTKNPTVPDYRSVIDAVARRDKARCVVDGMTAANTLGLTNAVPAKIEVLVDARLKPIQLGNQKIVFKHAAPRKIRESLRLRRGGTQSLTYTGVHRETPSCEPPSNTRNGETRWTNHRR